MLKNGWVSFALYLAVSGVSLAEEKKADPYARIDLHPDCVNKDPENLLRNCGFETGDFDGRDLSGDFSNTFVTETARHSGNFGVLAHRRHWLSLPRRYPPLRNRRTPSVFGSRAKGNRMNSSCFGTAFSFRI